MSSPATAVPSPSQAGAIIDVSATNPQTSAAILAAAVDKNGNLLDPSGIRLVPMLENGTTYYKVGSRRPGRHRYLRAPVEVIATGPATTAETVNISIANARSSIIGASAISVQGFRRWDLAAVAASGNFTGVTNDAGSITLDVTAGLDTINADGTTTSVTGLNFLGDNGPGTLVDSFRKFNISTDYGNLGGLASLPTFTANPGIDLTASGKIVLASNWNLGAGTVNQTAALAAGLMSIDPISGQAYVVSGDEGALLANYTTMFYRVGGSPTGARPGHQLARRRRPSSGRKHHRRVFSSIAISSIRLPSPRLRRGPRIHQLHRDALSELVRGWNVLRIVQHLHRRSEFILGQL